VVGQGQAAEVVLESEDFAEPDEDESDVAEALEEPDESEADVVLAVEDDLASARLSVR
jgi:hypothetical protein